MEAGVTGKKKKLKKIVFKEQESVTVQVNVDLVLIVLALEMKWLVNVQVNNL